MKFLVDRCAGRRLARWLESLGHTVIDATTFDHDPGDDILLSHAVAQECVLVTIDNDFGTLVYRYAVAHFGIIRLPDVIVPQRIMMMAWVLENHSADLASRAIITVQQDRIRVTR